MISGNARLLSYNSGHTATLRSAQISQRETSYVRKPLSEIRLGGFEVEVNIWQQK